MTKNAVLTSEAAGVAAISIVIRLVHKLIELDIVPNNTMQMVLTEAYQDQSDVANIPRTEVNAKAQKLIAALLRELQGDESATG